MGETSGYELLKQALGDKAGEILQPIKDETKELFNKIGGEQIKKIANEAKAKYQEIKAVTNEELKQFIYKYKPELKGKQSMVNKGGDVGEGGSRTSHSSRSTDVLLGSTLEQKPILSNKTLLTLEQAREQIPEGSKLSQLYPQYNKAAESLNNIEGLNNLQAAALVYVHNGINAGETIRHPLGSSGELKLATILTIQLLSAMKGKENQLLSMSNTFASNPLTKKMSLDKMITEGTTSIQQTGLIDQIGGVTSLFKGFNEAKPILEKANTMLEFLRNGTSALDASTMTSDQLEQLYHLCVNRSFPKDQDLVAITTTMDDTQWHQSKLTSLTVTQTMVSLCYDHLTTLSFIDPKNQQKTKELATAAQQGADMVYDVIGQWFGVDKGSAMMDQWIESLMKFFDNPLLGALANMAGIDLSTIKQTLSGEFTPTQEQQFTTVMKGYNDLVNADGKWVARLSSWVSDRTSTRFTSLEKFNINYLKEHLHHAPPHVSVVSALVGSDETLKATYLDTQTTTTSDGTIAQQTIVKPGVDYRELAELFVVNDAIVKSVIDSSRWTTTQDVAGLLTAQWMKGDIRGVRAWTKYQEKQATNKSEAKEDNHASSSQDVITSTIGSLHPYSNEIITIVPNSIKKQFGLETICFGQDSTVVEQAIAQIGNIRGWNEQQLSNFPLGVAAIYFRETGLKMGTALQPRDDRGQKARGLPQFSLLGDPKQEAQKHFDAFVASPYGQGIDVSSLTDITDPRRQTIAYLGYLMKRNSSGKMFDMLAQLPSITDHQQAKTIVKQIQGSANLGNKDEKAYVFLHKHKIGNYLNQASMVASSPSKSQSISSKG